MSEKALDIGSRLELFVDDFLVAERKGEARLRLHNPQRREIVFVNDASWEGSACASYTVFRDGDICRMYYAAHHYPPDGNQDWPAYIAYAESVDGINWVKPNLGLYEINGSKENNIVLDSVYGDKLGSFAAFRDTNPDAPADARYKGLARSTKQPRGIYTFKSSDGIHWKTYDDGQPVMTGHPFDTQNTAFWDPNIGKYRAYIRDFDGGLPHGRRDIMLSTSDDFFNWTERQWLQYPGAPKEQLYTNQIKPYYRAPHILMGFPARYVDRGWVEATHHLPSLDLRQQRAETHPRYGSAVTDSLFMASRDGLTFHRWGEAFLWPGLRTQHNWAYGDNYFAWGMIETDSTEDDSPRELSFYAAESYFTGETSRLRRYTMRIDGFASAYAPLGGGEIITKPLAFQGKTLTINFATSAGGSVYVEIQNAAGDPLPGFALADCHEIFGDAIEYAVKWQGGQDVSALAEQPVRLRFVLKDADLYALRFE